MIGTQQECIVVWVGKSYLEHYAAYMGVLEAARRLKLKLRVQHGWSEIYIQKIEAYDRTKTKSVI